MFRRYIQSYEYLGNCYPIIETEDNLIVNSNSDIILNIISSCSLSSKNYIISSTNECVTECPETIPYNSFICNSIDFIEQEYGKNLPSDCTANQLNPPKFFLGSYCYESCPSNSENIELTNECKCLNAWHKDILSEEIICYEENYCKYDRYKYYISETKECTNSCPLGYFQFNNECYNNDCPPETISLSSISNNTIKNEFLNYLQINNDLINIICVCDIINNENIKWNYNSITKKNVLIIVMKKYMK